MGTNQENGYWWFMVSETWQVTMNVSFLWISSRFVNLWIWDAIENPPLWTIYASHSSCAADTPITHLPRMHPPILVRIGCVDARSGPPKQMPPGKCTLATGETISSQHIPSFLRGVGHSPTSLSRTWILGVTNFSCAQEEPFTYSLNCHRDINPGKASPSHCVWDWLKMWLKYPGRGGGGVQLPAEQADTSAEFLCFVVAVEQGRING